MAVWTYLEWIQASGSKALGLFERSRDKNYLIAVDNAVSDLDGAVKRNGSADEASLKKLKKAIDQWKSDKARRNKGSGRFDAMDTLLGQVDAELKKVGKGPPQIALTTSDLNRGRLEQLHKPTGIEVELLRQKKKLRGSDDKETEALAMAHKIKAGLRHEVKVKLSQTMSGMPQQAWNASFTWWTRFAMLLVDKELLIELRVETSEGSDVKAVWQHAIEEKWYNAVLVWQPNGGSPERYPIRVKMNFGAYPPHCAVKGNAPGNVHAGGTHGVGGTLDMTTWGTGDALDIPHEIGHMLGAPDNYGDIVFAADPSQAKSWPKGRANGYGLMNNPAEDTVPRNYWLITREFPKLMQKYGNAGTVIDVEIGRQ